MNNTDTATIERPILFSGEMVRAILDGTKTQTRRVIKSHPLIDGGFNDEFIKSPGNYVADDCPHGQPGDRLWVREAWRAGTEWDDDKPSEIDPVQCDGGDIYYPADGRFLAHQYDGTVDDLGTGASPDVFGKLRPSIFMPRWASRISLEITDVRVERVREISGSDIMAEGAVLHSPFAMVASNLQFPVSAFDGAVYPDLKSLWASGWDKIYANRGYGWNVNPWVWVVEFKRIAEQAS